VLGLVIAAQLLWITPAAAQARPQPEQQKESPNAFDERAASRLLEQLAEGLNGRLVKKTLSAFDLQRMNGGQVFKEHITAFISQTDSIRTHFKLVEVKDNTVVADVEMDAVPRNDIVPPQHKHAQVRFTAASLREGWKFTDVEPRGFFSLQ
jgi:hypothetical protein